MYPLLAELGATFVIMLLLTQVGMLLLLKFNKKAVAKGSYIATALLAVFAIGAIATTPKGLMLIGLI